MPSVLDAPERMEYVETHELTTHDLTIEQPRTRRSRPGFWRTLAHRMTRLLTHTPRVRQVPSCRSNRPCEDPMDRLIREHRSLALLALSTV